MNSRSGYLLLVNLSSTCCRLRLHLQLRCCTFACWQVVVVVASWGRGPSRGCWCRRPRRRLGWGRGRRHPPGIGWLWSCLCCAAPCAPPCPIAPATAQGTMLPRRGAVEAAQIGRGSCAGGVGGTMERERETGWGWDWCVFSAAPFPRMPRPRWSDCTSAAATGSERHGESAMSAGSIRGLLLLGVRMLGAQNQAERLHSHNFHPGACASS